MSQPSSPDPTEVVVLADPATETAVEAPVEPLTPEGVLNWNRYYDRYVVGGLLFLIFFVSAHKITSDSSSIWSMIRTGEVIVKRGGPVTTDIFSFTEAGKPWVNVSWLYDVGSYLVFSAGKSFSPEDAATGEQIGAGFLVTLNALVRVLAVVLLLRLRKTGPGGWWFVVVAAIGMGVVLAPRFGQLDLSVGGIARQANLSPDTWGVLFLAATVLLLDRGLSQGKTKALFALPVLFFLWANVDESVAFGLIVVAISLILALRKSRFDTVEPTPSPVLLGSILASCVAICLVNPSTWRIFPAIFESYFSIPKMLFSSDNNLPMRQSLSFFGSDSWRSVRAGRGESEPVLRLCYYFAIVGIGLLSFGLNYRRLRLSRLILFVVSAILWGCLNALSAEFAVIFVLVVGLNGQEWFQSTYGLRGHLGGSWTALSVGGRALTILTLFLVTFYTLSGYGYEVGRATFGFGFDPGDFAFEAADFLKTSKIEGEILNLSDSQGDALIYRAYPTRKTFYDRRNHVFDREVRSDLREFGRSFSVEKSAVPTGEQDGPEASADDSYVLTAKDDPSKWRPILDKYKVSAVLVSPEDSLIVYGVMLTSKNWILLHHDGRAVLFGRSDASEADLALFQKEKLEADELVYQRKARVPFPDRSPSPMTFGDRIIRNRSLAKPQPHVTVGEHWISAGENIENRGLTPASNAILAVREARKAIHFNPDSTYAYRLLDRAYEKLSQNEIAVFEAKGVAIPAGLYNFRARQRVAALNYAIQTTPPPRDANEKLVLEDSYMRLALLHRRAGEIDLERDALAAARDLAPARLEETKRLDQLDDLIARFKDDLQKASTDRNMSEPIARANYALTSGFPGLAIHELEEAENTGVPLDQFLSMLVNLYCRTGQPEKANEKLTNRPLDDPALFGGAGTPAYTHGLVNYLMGYYDNTIAFWRDNALAQAVFSEKNQELAVAREILGGLPENAVNTTIDVTGIPGKPGLIENESTWEFELALCLLEAGDPEAAGQRFLKCLKLNPKIVVRPLVEFYLQKLKVPIPPTVTDSEPKPEAPAEVKAAVSKPEAPVDVAPKQEVKPEPPK